MGSWPWRWRTLLATTPARVYRRLRVLLQPQQPILPPTSHRSLVGKSATAVITIGVRGASCRPCPTRRVSPRTPRCRRVSIGLFTQPTLSRAKCSQAKSIRLLVSWRLTWPKGLPTATLWAPSCTRPLTLANTSGLDVLTGTKWSSSLTLTALPDTVTSAQRIHTRWLPCAITQTRLRTLRSRPGRQCLVGAPLRTLRRTHSQLLGFPLISLTTTRLR